MLKCSQGCKEGVVTLANFDKLKESIEQKESCKQAGPSQGWNATTMTMLLTSDNKSPSFLFQECLGIKCDPIGHSEKGELSCKYKSQKPKLNPL